MVIMETHTHAYQVSPPCIVWCASLRGEEVVIGKVPEAIFCSWSSWKRIHMHTKFHLRALYGVQV